MDNILIKINNIIKTNINELPYYDLTEILKLNAVTISILLNGVCDNINFSSIQSYKKQQFEPIIIFISKVIINASKKNININDLFNKNSLFITISLVH
jgi:hypothetical protein